jgi:hypothetical protein
LSIHKDVSEAKIMNFVFTKGKGDNRMPPQIFLHSFPTKVVIRFSDRYGDYAEYELRQVGPKGI